jgi:hypothetical protein
MAEKFMAEKFMAEKFMVQKFMVEKFVVEIFCTPRNSSKGNPNLTPLKNIFCSNLMLLPFESFHRIKCLAL